MTDSRRKGSQFERDIAKRLFLLTGMTFTRNLEQVRAIEECDLLCDNPAWPFSLELKRYAKGCDPLSSWIAQTEKAAAKSGKLPCLIYKFDNKPIKCHVPFRAIGTAIGARWSDEEWATITLDGLAFLASEIMADRQG